MEAKEYLRQLAKISSMIRRKQSEKEQWELIATGTTAPAGGERVRSTGTKSKMSDAIIRAVDIEGEILKLVNRRQEIIKTIEQLEVMEYNVLHMRYVIGMGFKAIALECGQKSESWANTVHRKALRNLQKILDEKERR